MKSKLIRHVRVASFDVDHPQPETVCRPFAGGGTVMPDVVKMIWVP
jgi:hypothetical protein